MPLRLLNFNQHLAHSKTRHVAPESLDTVEFHIRHGITYLAEPDSDLALAALQSAACTYRIALGPRAGQKVLSLKTVPTHEVQSTAKRCVSEHGFSLHADVRCAANQRNQLERLCRHITRPAIANERLKRNRAG